MKTRLSIYIALIIFTATAVLAQNKSAVPYKLVQGYFVKNTFKSEASGNLKIVTAEKFNEIFGMATVMGANGKPTNIDFKKQFVIAVINDITEVSTEFVPEKLEKIGKRKLHFQFETKYGEKQTYSSRPFLILVVDSKYKNRKIEFSTHAVL